MREQFEEETGYEAKLKSYYWTYWCKGTTIQKATYYEAYHTWLEQKNKELKAYYEGEIKRKIKVHNDYMEVLKKENKELRAELNKLKG